MKPTSTKSPYRKQAIQAIEKMARLLDDEWIHHEIETPVDRVLEAFRFDTQAPLSITHFHEVAAGFVLQVFRHAKRLRQELTEPEARGEVMRLLERYEGVAASGYEASVCDLTQNIQIGIREILTQMAATIKMEEREKHVAWVMDRAVDPSDWCLKCALTEVLVEYLRPYLSSALEEKTIPQLASAWRDLLLTHIRVQNVSRHLESKQNPNAGG